MQITKAVITAAGRGARQYPAADTVQKAMLPLVDRDGLAKPILQIIAEEAIESGIEEICIVSAPGTRVGLPQPLSETTRRTCGLHSAGSSGGRGASPTARRPGASAPVRCSARAAGVRSRGLVRPRVRRRCPLLLLLGITSIFRARRGGAPKQLIDLVAVESCSVSGVQATREHSIHQYGTLTGKNARRHDQPAVYAIDEIIEKPNPTLAELRLQVPGPAPGTISASLGFMCSPPAVFDLLDQLVRTDTREQEQIQLTTALNELGAAGEIPARSRRGGRGTTSG